MSLVLVSGQFFGTFDNAYRFGYDSVGNDFGSSSFGAINSGPSSVRDPRQNRGTKSQVFEKR